VKELNFDDAHIEASGEPLSSMPLSDDELKSADCVIIVTDHSEIDYKRVCSLAPADRRHAQRLKWRTQSASKARVIRL
jgi:UDP-N-acetyl-D-glucosamine dehydrogenase